MIRITSLLFFSLVFAAPAQAALKDALQTVRDAVPGQFIVATTRGSDPGLPEQLTRAVGGRLLHRYDSAFQGFALQADAKSLLALLKRPDVRYIEQVAKVAMSADRAVWGLDRIDQRALPLNGDYKPANDGPDVHIYIVDTGIRSGHNEFRSRLGEGANFAGRSATPGGGGGLGETVSGVIGGVLGGGRKEEPAEQADWEDCNGHGTHVAGTAAGKTYGVARKAKLHAVRVLDCDGSGTTADVIAGVDWVTKNASVPAVANLSLGGGASQAMDDAVAGAVKQGIAMVVAAGNENQDACGSSPAREPSAITVGATTPTDERASFSNYGRCVDIFAPGAEIVSAWHSSDDASKELQGTSMAAPHVAGVIAILLADNGEASPRDLAAELESRSAEDRIGGVKGSPNRMLQVPQRDGGGEGAESSGSGLFGR